MHRPSFHRRFTGLRPWASLVCLLAYLAGVPELLPELLGLLCSFDRSHTVSVIHAGGEVRLTVSHDSARLAEASLPAASKPAAAGVRLAGLAQTTPNSDHQASFACASVVELSDEQNSLGKARGTTELARWAPERDSRDGGNARALALALDRTSPCSGPLAQLLRTLRTTVLVI